MGQGRGARRVWARIRVRLLDLVILAAWLSSVGMAVLHERGQLFGGAGNITASLGATLDAREQWFGLYYQGQKIGFSNILIMPEELNGMPGVGLVDRGRLSFTLLGQPQQLEIWGRAFIDADWRLRAFRAAIRSSTYELTWTGRRQGETLIVTVTTPTTTFTKPLRDPTGTAFVNGLSSWVAFHRLQVGQSGKAWLLNPLALNPELVYFHVRRSDVMDGQRVLVVESDVAGMTTTSWVTPTGDVLRETSPLGWELRRESQKEALAKPQIASPGLDLLSSASVPVDRALESPEDITQLTLLIEGAECRAFTVQRAWQIPQGPERLAEFHRAAPHSPWCLMQLDRPWNARSRPAIPSAIQRYEQPSPYVQSDDAQIIAKAREIAGVRADPLEQMLALNQWVFSTLAKRLTVGLPSAIDVLETLAGDCHEHTVLFTALARSLGLPTRMVAGLVYWQGRFYYHAWPEVWCGVWLPTDPTLGQGIADATHVGLVEAESEHLIALGQFVGTLHVQVLDVQRLPQGTERGEGREGVAP